MRPRHGSYARDLRTLSARPALAVRATWALCAAAPTTWALRTQCVRDLGLGCAHSAPNPVLIQCTVYSHCLDTVHRDFKKKKNTKFLKIFLCVI